jgi:hypothetical protein
MPLRSKLITSIAVCALALSLPAPAAEPRAPKEPVVAPNAVVVRDAKTGTLRPATAQEIQAAAAEIDRFLGRGTPVKETVRLADGKTAVQLTGNFTSGFVARRNADGKLEIFCFDEPEPAKRFLGLVPAAPAPSVKGEEK